MRVYLLYHLPWRHLVNRLALGQRHDMQCASISSFSGQVIPWTTEIRYLGVWSYLGLDLS